MVISIKIIEWANSSLQIYKDVLFLKQVFQPYHFTTASRKINDFQQSVLFVFCLTSMQNIFFLWDWSYKTPAAWETFQLKTLCSWRILFFLSGTKTREMFAIDLNNTRKIHLVFLIVMQFFSNIMVKYTRLQ